MNELLNEIMLGGELNGFTPLNEASRRSLNRVFNNLERFPYVIISADRHELSKEQNLTRYDKLKKIVNNRGFSYIPVKGGFIEENDNQAVYENSLIIFPIGKNRKEKSEKELFFLGVELIQYDPIQQDENGDFVGDDPTDVESFGQDSFLFKGDGGVAAYYGKDGEKQFEVGNNYIVNDKFQQYFTQLWNSTGKDNVGKFTFTEAYITYEPRTVAGRHIRYLEGELLNYY